MFLCLIIFSNYSLFCTKTLIIHDNCLCMSSIVINRFILEDNIKGYDYKISYTTNNIADGLVISYYQEFTSVEYRKYVRRSCIS